jgi:cytochrome d ubiquinol oxidase subunit I
MSANSWMQTPDGVVLENGRLVVTDWWKVIANPSWPYRLPHMLMAAWITGSFAVAGIGAWYLLKGRHEAFGRRTVSMGTGFAVVLIAVQVFLGDVLYGRMLQHQPSKMQAGEGFWEKQSESPAPYYWIIVPDQEQQRNRFTLGTPYLGSILLTHSLDGRACQWHPCWPRWLSLLPALARGRALDVAAMLHRSRGLWSWSQLP